jgi:hypothetical protein
MPEWVIGPNQMKRLYQWVREFFKRVGRWIYARIIDTKFMYLVVGIAIGGSVMFIKLEAPIHYQWIVEGQRYTEVFNKSGIAERAEARTEVKENASGNAEGEKVSDPTPSVSEIADYIHLRESTNGTAKVGLHATCKARVLSNEYGYNPPKCYDNNNQVRLIVEDWISRHLAEGLSVDELLLHYSNGAYTYEK